MIRKNKCKNYKIPPADVILDILNENPNTENRILDFYENYITAVAKQSHEPKADFISKEDTEDLAQEIRIAVARCIPALRKVLINTRLNNEPLVVVITQI